MNTATSRQTRQTHAHFPVPIIAGVSPIQRDVSAGDYLFRMGDRSVGFYFLESGRLRMQRVTPDGGTVVLHVPRGGELFAEASLFSERYQCDVLAEVTSVAWLYSRNEMVGRLQSEPATLWEFAGNLARSLHGMRLRYELKQIRSAPERLLQYIRLHSDDAGIFQANGSLKAVAAEIGLTHETLYRALSSLEKDGAIMRSKEHLQIMLKLPRPQRDK